MVLKENGNNQTTNHKTAGWSFIDSVMKNTWGSSSWFFEITNHGDPDDSLIPILSKRTETNEWFSDSEVLKRLETTQWFVFKEKKNYTTQWRMDGLI